MGSIIGQPNVTVSITNANVAVGNTAQRVLIVGQMLAAGSAVAGSLVENIPNDNSEDSYFGQASLIAGMVRAFKKINKSTIVDALPLDDDGSGVQATGSIALTDGPASAAGSYEIVIGSEKNHKFTVAVASADTATEVGAAIAAAINADADCPVTAAASTGTVTLTADNAGTLGNDIGISVSGTVAGLTVAVTGMASGATDPTLTSIFDAIGSRRYQTIVWPYADDLSEVTTLLDARFNADNKVLDGVAITCKRDSLANHLVALAALNDQSVTYFCDKSHSETYYKGPAQFELSPVKASLFAAVRALRLTEDAVISQYVISSNGPLDAFGGPALASKPYFNTPFSFLPLVSVARGWTDTEIEQLFYAGGSVLGNNSAGNSAICGEILTTYKTDSAGNDDVSFKFLNYVDTASNAREYFFNNLKSRFAQSRLTTGDVLHGRDMANDLTIQAYCEKLYQDLSGTDYVLLQAGEAATKFFKDNLDISLDLANGKATITMIVPLVVQLREINVTMKIAFSTEG
jgi:phage tail sheath gpL-like